MWDEVLRRIGEEPFRTQLPFVMHLLEHCFDAGEQEIRVPLLFELIRMCQGLLLKDCFR